MITKTQRVVVFQVQGKPQFISKEESGNISPKEAATILSKQGDDDSRQVYLIYEFGKALVLDQGINKAGIYDYDEHKIKGIPITQARAMVDTWLGGLKTEN